MSFEVPTVESANPFVFDRPLSDVGQLVGRERQLAELAAALEAGGEALVEGPVGHGKTSLASVGLAGWTAGREDRLGVLVDCLGVLTVEDLARRVEEALVNARAEGLVGRALSERLEALTFNTGVGGAPPELEKLLALPVEVAERSESRAVVCLDEFQDALTVPGVLESLHDVRKGDRERVSYVFVGPELRSLGKPPGRPAVWGKRPTAVGVGVIDPGLLAAHITQRFSATGRDAGEAAGVIAQVGSGYPQRTMLLAHQLWQLTPEGDRATVAWARAAIQETLARLAPELNLRWQALHANERRVAVAIANQIAPQGTKAQRATGLASFSAAQRALQGIQNAGVAHQQGGTIALTDPLFAEYLRRRYPLTAASVDRRGLRYRAQSERGSMTPRL